MQHLLADKLSLDSPYLQLLRGLVRVMRSVKWRRGVERLHCLDHPALEACHEEPANSSVNQTTDSGAHISFGRERSENASTSKSFCLESAISLLACKMLQA